MLATSVASRGLTEDVPTSPTPGKDRLARGFAPIPDEPKANRDVTEDVPTCQSRRDWLGGRDSNPDNHVQSVVSYR